MQQTKQGKRNTNSVHLKRRQLAGEEKRVSEKYLKEFTNFTNSSDYEKM